MLASKASRCNLFLLAVPGFTGFISVIGENMGCRKLQFEEPFFFVKDDESKNKGFSFCDNSNSKTPKTNTSSDDPQKGFSFVKPDETPFKKLPVNVPVYIEQKNRYKPVFHKVEVGKNLFSANVTSPASTDMLYSGEQFDPNLQMQYHYNMFVYKTGTRALETGIKSITNYLIANQRRMHDNATIIIHGVAPHEYGYATPFVQDLESRAFNQDYYEFTWSEFALTGGLVPNTISHRVAANNFRRAMLILQGKGYNNVNIVAHSWGTVVSRDVLHDGVGPVNTWVTMGSPLPQNTPRPDNLGYWLNIFSMEDYVVHYGSFLFEGGGGLFENQESVDEQIPITGGHTDYWTNQRTIEMISEILSDQ